MIDFLSSTAVHGRVCCAVGSEVWVALSSGRIRIYRAADAVAVQDAQLMCKDSLYEMVCMDVHSAHDIHRTHTPSSSSFRLCSPSCMIAVSGELWLGMSHGVVIRVLAATRQVVGTLDMTRRAAPSSDEVGTFAANATGEADTRDRTSRAREERGNDPRSVTTVCSAVTPPLSVAKIVDMCIYAHAVFDLVVVGCANGRVEVFSAGYAHQSGNKDRYSSMKRKIHRRRGGCNTSAPCTAVGLMHSEVCVRSPDSPCGVVISTEVVVVAGDLCGGLYAWDSDTLQALAVHTKSSSAVTCALCVESHSRGSPNRDRTPLLWVARANGNVDFYALELKDDGSPPTANYSVGNKAADDSAQTHSGSSTDAHCAQFVLHSRQSRWGRVLSLTRAADVVVAHTQAHELLILDRRTRLLLSRFAQAHERQIFGTATVGQQRCTRLWSVGNDARLRVWQIAQDMQPIDATQDTLGRVSWREGSLRDTPQRLSSPSLPSLSLTSSPRSELENDPDIAERAGCDSVKESTTTAHHDTLSSSLSSKIWCSKSVDDFDKNTKSRSKSSARRLWLREAWDSIVLRNALHHTRTALAELQLCHASCAAKAATATEEVHRRDSTIDELRASAVALTKQVTSITSQVNMVTQDRNALQQTVTRLRDEVTAAQGAIKQAEEAQLEARLARTRAEQECAALARRVADAEAQVASLRATNAQLEHVGQNNSQASSSVNKSIIEAASTRETGKIWSNISHSEVQQFAARRHAELDKAHAALRSALYTIRSLEADKTDLVTMLVACRERLWQGCGTRSYADPLLVLPHMSAGCGDHSQMRPTDVLLGKEKEDQNSCARVTNSRDADAASSRSPSGVGALAPLDNALQSSSSIPSLTTAQALTALLGSMISVAPPVSASTTNTASHVDANTSSTTVSTTANTADTKTNYDDGSKSMVQQGQQVNLTETDNPRSVDELLQQLGISTASLGRNTCLTESTQRSSNQPSQAVTTAAEANKEKSFCHSVTTAAHTASCTVPPSCGNDNQCQTYHCKNCGIGGTIDADSNDTRANDHRVCLWDLSLLCAGSNNEVTTVQDMRALFEFILSTREELVNSLVALEQRALKAQHTALNEMAHNSRSATTTQRRQGKGVYRRDGAESKALNLPNRLLDALHDLARQTTQIVWRFLTRSEKRRMNIA